MNIVIRLLSAIQVAIATIFLVAAVGVSSMAIFWRYVLGSPLDWTDEVGRILMPWMVMIAAAELARRRDHITVDTLLTALSARGRAVLERLADVAGIIFLSVLVVNGTQLAMRGLTYPLPATGIPLGVAQLAIPVGATMMIAWLVIGCLSGRAADRDSS
jgi:TRAP-type transport system small permease protein